MLSSGLYAAEQRLTGRRRVQVPARSPSAPAAPALLGTAPATQLSLEPRPQPVFDDNPVLDERSAAFLLGVSADCLKKWRRRHQGPDYTQYGQNGIVRYELKALMEFRDKHRVRAGSRK